MSTQILSPQEQYPQEELWHNRIIERSNDRYHSFNELSKAVHDITINIQDAPVIESEQVLSDEWLSYHQMKEIQRTIFRSDLSLYRSYILALNRKRADYNADQFYK